MIGLGSDNNHGVSKPIKPIPLDIFGYYLPRMQDEAAILMDELVTPIAPYLQQNCISKNQRKGDFDFIIFSIEDTTSSMMIANGICRVSDVMQDLESV